MHFFEFNLPELIETIGYIGIFAIVFAESGLFFGFFLPGDSLLFTAGFLASQKILNINILIPLVVTGAVLGDQAGYLIGEYFGKWLEKKKESFIFSKHNLEKAKAFYQKHGGKAITLARFIPAVRTFVPIVAGMTRLEYKKFIKFNVIGGIIWGAGMPTAGFYLGKSIPDVDKYLLPIIFGIIFVSLLPNFFHFRKEIKNKTIKIILAIKEKYLG